MTDPAWNFAIAVVLAAVFAASAVAVWGGEVRCSTYAQQTKCVTARETLVCRTYAGITKCTKA